MSNDDQQAATPAQASEPAQAPSPPTPPAPPAPRDDLPDPTILSFRCMTFKQMETKVVRSRDVDTK